MAVRESFMAISIRECTLADWQGNAERIDTGKYRRPILIHQNLFMSCQFMGDEALEMMRPKAFCLEADGLQVAWALVYFLSPKVLRLRGLYVDPSHRQKGYMRSLIDYVCEHYKGQGEKLLSFSTPQGLDFHLRSGFKLVDEFQPRPVEHYDPVTGQSLCDEGFLYTLFERKI